MIHDFKHIAAAFFVAVGFATSVSAGPITIDDFTVPAGTNQRAQTAGDTTGVFNGLNGIAMSHTIGGVRELYARNNLGANLTNPSNRYATTGGFGVGGFGNPAATGFGVGSFNYDGAIDNTGAIKGTVGTGLGIVDLTGGGTNTGLKFDGWTVVGSVQMTVTLNTLTGNLTAIHSGSSTDPFSFTLAFATDFTGAGSATKVRGIQIFIEVLDGLQDPGSDVGLQSIVALAVPEPSTVVMGLLGTVGLVAIGRRKK